MRTTADVEALHCCRSPLSWTNSYPYPYFEHDGSTTIQKKRVGFMPAGYPRVGGFDMGKVRCVCWSVDDSSTSSRGCYTRRGYPDSYQSHRFAGNDEDDRARHEPGGVRTSISEAEAGKLRLSDDRAKPNFHVKYPFSASRFTVSGLKSST